MLKSHTFLTVRLDVISIGSVGTPMYSSWMLKQSRQELYGGGTFSKVKNEDQDFELVATSNTYIEEQDFRTFYCLPERGTTYL